MKWTDHFANDFSWARVYWNRSHSGFVWESLGEKRRPCDTKLRIKRKNNFLMWFRGVLSQMDLDNYFTIMVLLAIKALKTTRLTKNWPDNKFWKNVKDYFEGWWRLNDFFHLIFYNKWGKFWSMCTDMYILYSEDWKNILKSYYLFECIKKWN